MTLNVAVATWDFVACVSDRRLIGLGPDRPILSERSNKLTMFDLGRNRRGLITYNGIGRDGDGKTPNDWLAELPLRWGMSLDELAQLIKEDAEPRIARAAPLFGDNPRHSFVVAAFNSAIPMVGLISNYEHIKRETNDERAGPHLRVDWLGPVNLARTSHCLFLAGALPQAWKSRVGPVVIPALRTGRPPELVMKRMIKVVRDAAFAAGRRGSVSTSVMAAFIPQFGNAVDCSDVLGGTEIMEGPNLITPGAKFRDPYFSARGTERQQRMGRGESVEGMPFGVTERPCPNPKCGAPVPEGYRRCGVCDTPMSPPAAG